jgi:hypothetical protein
MGGAASTEASVGIGSDAGEQEKQRGNTAFRAGEYVVAIAWYTQALERHIVAIRRQAGLGGTALSSSTLNGMEEDTRQQQHKHEEEEAVVFDSDDDLAANADGDVASDELVAIKKAGPEEAHAVAVLYSNRALAHGENGQHDLALCDAEACCTIDARWAKVRQMEYIRYATHRCHARFTADACDTECASN